jgi:hypothetical protein
MSVTDRTPRLKLVTLGLRTAAAGLARSHPAVCGHDWPDRPFARSFPDAPVTLPTPLPQRSSVRKWKLVAVAEPIYPIQRLRARALRWRANPRRAALRRSAGAR